MQAAFKTLILVKVLLISLVSFIYIYIHLVLLLRSHLYLFCTAQSAIFVETRITIRESAHFRSFFSGCPDSSVGIATRYGLDGPGIESRWGGWAIISSPAQTGTGAHPASCTMDTGSFSVVKLPGRDADPSPPSSVKVKVKVLPITGHEGPEGE